MQRKGAETSLLPFVNQGVNKEAWDLAQIAWIFLPLFLFPSFLPSFCLHLPLLTLYAFVGWLVGCGLVLLFWWSGGLVVKIYSFSFSSENWTKTPKRTKRSQKTNLLFYLFSACLLMRDSLSLCFRSMRGAKQNDKTHTLITHERGKESWRVREAKGKGTIAKEC